MHTVEIHGVTVRCDSADEVLALLPTPSLRPIAKTLHEAIDAVADKIVATAPARKKPGPKPKDRMAGTAAGKRRPIPRPPAADDVLTPEQKAALAAEVPLICRKPRGCGKPFESKNRMAWYCPACTAKRDEGRPV